jgi:hypothetical protein
MSFVLSLHLPANKNWPSCRPAEYLVECGFSEENIKLDLERGLIMKESYTELHLILQW